VILQSARSGRGDRADPSVWPAVEGPLKVMQIFAIWLNQSDAKNGV
jgi:hypothetical protein